MKRMTKKLGAIVLALAMCFSLCCTALAAADSYSITISNANIGSTYNVYKIFDATVSDDGKSVSYTISTSSPWYDDVSGATDLFKMTAANAEKTIYTVEKVDTAKDEDIVSFLAGLVTVENGTLTGLTPDASKQATSSTLTISLDEPGYYFVTSSLGAVVTITTTDPDAIVIDKNTPPGNLEKVVNNGLNDNTDGTGEDGSLHEDTEAMGDDVKFTVTADVPLYAPGDSSSLEGYLVTDYEFIDHMDAGLEIRGLTTEEGATKESSCDYYTEDGETYYATNTLIDKWVILYDDNGDKVSILNYAHDVTLQLTYPTEYVDDTGNTAIQFDGFTLSYNTISLEAYETLKEANPEGYDTAYELVQALNALDSTNANYPANAKIEIDYYAHVADQAAYENTNEISMDWHMTTFRGPTPDNPRYSGEDDDSDDVYVLSLEILKVDAQTSAALEGAQFQLSGTNLNEVVTSTDYHYTPLENLNAYREAKSEGIELYFKLTDGTYTNVDPYDLPEGDSALNNYEKNTYADDPTTYPDAEGYYYVAYELTEAHSGGLQSATDQTVTGWTSVDGKLTFSGLTVGDWTLTELTAPDGYNLLPEDFKMMISVSWGVGDEGKIVPTFSVQTTSGSSNYELGDDGVIRITVTNNAGTELPGTGGIGTTIFYIIGGILVVGAVVVLVTRRRMTRES